MQADDSLVDRVERYDRIRPGVPGEHWWVLGAAVGVWLATRRHPALAVRLLGSVAGTALVARAASGRKVPHKLVEWLPFERAHRRAAQHANAR